MTFSDYTVKISDDPGYYGSNCTVADGEQIAASIATLIQSEFPGINTEIFHDGYGSSRTTGPDASVIEDINLWIENNWQAAL